jgi:hypothetical protein
VKKAIIKKNKIPCNIGSYGNETKSCPNVTAFFEFCSGILKSFWQNGFGCQVS